MKFQKLWYSLLIILLSALLFWLFSQVLIVKKIDCSLNQQPCSEELLVQTHKLSDQSLFFTDFNNLVSRFVINQPIKFSKLQKKLPQTLKIDFETLPIAYQLKFSAQTFDVTSNGKLFEKISAETVEIQVNDQLFDQMIEKGSVKPGVNLQITQVIRLLTQEQQKIKKFEFKNLASVILVLENNPQILLNPQDMARSLFQYFGLIKPEIANYSTPIMEVDMRFKYPILRSTVSQL